MSQALIGAILRDRHVWPQVQRLMKAALRDANNDVKIAEQLFFVRITEFPSLASEFDGAAWKALAVQRFFGTS